MLASNKELSQESTRRKGTHTFSALEQMHVNLISILLPFFSRSAHRDIIYYITGFYPGKGGATGKVRERTLGICRTDRLCPGT